MKVTKEQFIGVTYDELLAENDRLRELANDLFAMCTSDCFECANGYDDGSCKLYDRMRELGVEVTS